jgi:hypothetical protein
LIRHDPNESAQHIGTTDVDIVIDFEMIAEVDAYRRLEENLKAMNFKRGTNEEGHAQNHSWRAQIDDGISVVIDLLCDAPEEEGRRIARVPGEKALSAIRIAGTHLALHDFITVELTAELLGERGVATEHVKVANIVPFIVLKALAYDDRAEQKDAYDIVYCMMNYGDGGPDDVATQFRSALERWTDEPLLSRAVEVLRDRFASDETVLGYRKDGPVSYASFLTWPHQPDENARRQRDAAGVIERFLERLDDGG